MTTNNKFSGELKMKKALVMALAIGMVGNAYAGCPSNINGRWSGTVVNSQSTVTQSTDGTKVSNYTGNVTLTLNISGETGVINYLAMTTSQPDGKVIESTTPEAVAVSYNKSGCRGTINDDVAVTYFTVSNNGKTLKGVSYESDSGSYSGGTYKSGLSSLWVFERQ